MDNKLIFVFFASVILSGVHSEVRLNKETISVNKDDNYNMVCEAINLKGIIKACAWITPQGKTYILWNEATYEAGRIKQFGNADKECGISVNRADDIDNGKWTCQVTSIDETNNAISETKSVDVTVAVPPQKIQLKIDENFSPKDYNFKMSQDKKGEAVSVDCIAAEAIVEPEFQWFLGNDPLNAVSKVNTADNESGKKDFTATLQYYPDAKHDGKELRCQVTHPAYTAAQKQKKENIAQVALKIQYPPQPSQTVKKHYDLNVGQANTIRMQFQANPQPSEGFWTINKTKIQIGAADKDNKYSSGSIVAKDGAQGEWEVELTINALAEADTKGTHSLTIQNEEGSAEYKFELYKGEQPPPGNSNIPVEIKGSAADSNSLTVGIIVIIVIIVVIIVLVIVARAKAMLCFAGMRKGEDDSEQAMDKEGSDTESAENGSTKGDTKDSKDGANKDADDDNEDGGEDNHDDAKKEKTSVATKMSNFFTAMRKSVNSKGNKEKYEQTESEMKLNDGDEKKDLEGGEKDDITYADLDDNALSSGNRKSSLTVENEQTEYAEIKPSH